MAKHLNPLEKEFLIRQYKGNPRISLNDFCDANHITPPSLKKWIKQYDEGGLEGLARADAEINEVLPEGIDRTEESYKREILKLRIENERLKKAMPFKRTRLGTGVCSFKGEEFEIVELLSRDYDVQMVCKLMNVSRAGYYKWKKRDKSKRDLSREEMVELVKNVHEEHSTHGYRWTAAFIRINHSQSISDNYAYKCYKYLGIKAETRHQVHYKPRKVKDRFPNLIFTTWDTVDRPRQVVVSDMVTFKFWIYYYEATFYFDVFTKEMLTYKLAERRGSRMQYIDGLEDVKGLLRSSAEPTILHTDQGSVYAFMAYNELIKDTNIIRSMSRAGKPTDNPVNESLNGWIKEELMMDFKLEECHRREDVETAFKKYQKYYNEQRPCFAVGYDTPANYRRRYNNGELPHKNSFEERILTEVPKFVQKKQLNVKNQENNKDVSTYEKENLQKTTKMTTFAN